MKKRLVVLTGAGISAESGIKTFRDCDGTWENYNIDEVATIGGWYKDPNKVTQFYNEHRKQLLTVEPNAAHLGLKDLEEKYDVFIVTQNVDNLHERAGSSSVVHLHGELTKICNENKTHIKDIGCVDAPEFFENGEKVRPYVVWFGENVPLIKTAELLVESADILVIIGTSMVVYPAAGLASCKKEETPLYIINPEEDKNPNYYYNSTYIQEKATIGVKLLINKYLK